MIRSGMWRAFHKVAPSSAVRVTEALAAVDAGVGATFDVLMLQEHCEAMKVRQQILEADVVRLDGALDYSLARESSSGRLAAEMALKLEEQNVRLAEITAGLHEQRKLSLRVAQLTDLVFERLASAAGGVEGSAADLEGGNTHAR